MAEEVPGSSSTTRFCSRCQRLRTHGPLNSLVSSRLRLPFQARYQGSYSRALFDIGHHDNTMAFGDAEWKISGGHMRGIDQVLLNAGISLPDAG